MFDILAVWLNHQWERSVSDVRGSRELAMLADDIGVSADALEAAAGEADGDVQQLASLLRALGIDEAALGRAQPTLLRDLEAELGLDHGLLEVEHAEELMDEAGFPIPYLVSAPFWSSRGKPTLH